jgi:hydroxypyruvate isomerase
MPKYAANLTMLWPELGDPYARFAAAAAAGFTRVERLFLHDLDPERVRGLLADLGLSLVLFDPYPGDWQAGERGLLALPGREPECRESVLAALDTAGRLGTGHLNVLAGVIPPGADPGRCLETAAANLAGLAPVAEAAGVTLLLEAINPYDMPGYALPTIGDAAALVRAVSHPAVALQFDAYHVGRTGGDLFREIEATFGLVRHVQVADVPGRHQPGTGALPLAGFLARLDELGYTGAVGLEYLPEGPTDQALAWLPVAQRG